MTVHRIGKPRAETEVCILKRITLAKRLTLAVLSASLLSLGGCASRADGGYYYNNASFAGYDIRVLGAGKEDAAVADPAVYADTSALRKSQNTAVSPEEEQFHTATVDGEMLNVYISPTTSSRIVMNFPKGTELEIAFYSKEFWQVKKAGIPVGYCKAEGAFSGLWDNYYGYLPAESGMAPTASSEMVPAVSELVDLRLYLENEDDVIIKMKLATDGTTIGEPFYHRNLCMLQKDTVQKFLKAVERFAEDGYKVVIYDAYRPTSVQQRWFDVVRVHKWVANPAIGMGGIHDRGVAIDMSLVDENGVELDMPTAMHTFTEASARSASMTAEQKKNVDYMTKIMVECGFTYINSEWWHFQDSLIVNYLPTDHPIDEIPLMYREVTE